MEVIVTNNYLKVWNSDEYKRFLDIPYKVEHKYDKPKINYNTIEKIKIKFIDKEINIFSNNHIEEGDIVGIYKFESKFTFEELNVDYDNHENLYYIIKNLKSDNEYYKHLFDNLKEHLKILLTEIYNYFRNSYNKNSFIKPLSKRFWKNIYIKNLNMCHCCRNNKYLENGIYNIENTKLKFYTKIEDFKLKEMIDIKNLEYKSFTFKTNKYTRQLIIKAKSSNNEEIEIIQYDIINKNPKNPLLNGSYIFMNLLI